MRDLKIAYGNSRTAKFWSNKTIKFDELCDRLRNPIYTSETAEEYPKLPKGQRDDIKDKGGFVAGRLIRWSAGLCWCMTLTASSRSFCRTSMQRLEIRAVIIQPTAIQQASQERE